MNVMDNLVELATLVVVVLVVGRCGCGSWLLWVLVLVEIVLAVASDIEGMRFCSCCTSNRAEIAAE